MKITSFQQFSALIKSQEHPVILLEGRRNISVAESKVANLIGIKLAKLFPHATFRSGNAEGSDEAFCSGVATVDSSRIEIVVPYGSHRKKHRIAGSKSITLDDTSEATKVLVREATVEATPTTKNLVKENASPRLAAKGRYLLRDSLKVFGDPGKIRPATAALFLVDPTDPMLGGTGHTLRVTNAAGVPSCNQDVWSTWLNIEG